MICCDDNDIMFTAASRFYEKTGDAEKHKQMEKALEGYDQTLEYVDRTPEDAHEIRERDIFSIFFTILFMYREVWVWLNVTVQYLYRQWVLNSYG